MGKFLLGIIVGIILIAAVVFGYFYFGYAPVATAAMPMPLEKKMAAWGLHAQLAKAASLKPPFEPTEDDYHAGALLYREHCAACHGLPGQQRTAIAKGEYPRPPQLYQHGVTDDPAGETYWKVANGIRMTGMPGFKNSLDDKQLWQVSLLLANADKVPASVNDVLKRPLPMDAPPSSDTAASAASNTASKPAR